MNWKGYERKQLFRDLRYYPIIFLEELRKITKVTVRIAGLQARLHVFLAVVTKRDT
jgi:hypothetical protein